MLQVYDHHDRQTLAEETLKKTVEHYQLAKEQAEMESQGLQYVSKHNTAANRQLFEQHRQQTLRQSMILLLSKKSQISYNRQLILEIKKENHCNN
ncbi:hypothetical protein [Candidatus Tisiphia endosymbiont of Ditula angustiorana]|uniref:hypothetical protein n=1 Tax=Candidatus Tisiphia endosymbiont of Ditula angustiorana TaxID=3066272 RepID=UPI00312C70D9